MPLSADRSMGSKAILSDSQKSVVYYLSCTAVRGYTVRSSLSIWYGKNALLLFKTSASGSKPRHHPTALLPLSYEDTYFLNSVKTEKKY